MSTNSGRTVSDYIRPLSENKIQSSYAARNTGIRAATGNVALQTLTVVHNRNG
jgi:hypothetical protein